MSTARHLHYTHEDYLRVEAGSPLRHEFADGEIYAMAGGTPEHAALCGRAVGLLMRLFPACTVLTSDARVRIPATGLSTYPDASVVCGPFVRAADDGMAIINPRILVEVTSPSTEDYDRGEKLSNYRQLGTLEGVMIVSHREVRVTLHTRNGPRWEAREYRRGELLPLPGGASLSADELYGPLAP